MILGKIENNAHWIESDWQMHDMNLIEFNRITLHWLDLRRVEESWVELICLPLVWMFSLLYFFETAKIQHQDAMLILSCLVLFYGRGSFLSYDSDEIRCDAMRWSGSEVEKWRDVRCYVRMCCRAATERDRCCHKGREESRGSSRERLR